jgi:hypothetical protein
MFPTHSNDWEHLTYAMSVNTYNNKRKQEK